MAETSYITEEMKKMVGVESPPVVYAIEKGAVKKFAEAIGDPNPLFQDASYARKTRYRRIIAPPTFPAYLRNPAVVERVIGFQSPLGRLLNAGNELEYFKPIKVGDVISVTGKLVNIRQAEGSRGTMLIFSAETTYRNKKGEVVAKGRQSLIKY